MASNSAFSTAIALVLAGVWACLLFVGTATDQLDHMAFVALLSITCYALYRKTRAGTSLPLPITIAAVLLASLATFSLWGILNGLFLPSFIPASTRSARIGLLLANGPFVSIITGLAMSYPLITLFKRFWLIPVMLGAAIALLTQLPEWLGSESSNTAKAIAAVGQASFFVLTPLAAFLLGRVCGWVANNSFRPKPLRGSA